MPIVAGYYFGNLLGDPSYRSRVPDLAKEAVAAGWPLDPLPNAPAALQQSDPATAIGLVEAAAAPRPTPDTWRALLAKAEAEFEAIRNVAAEVERERVQAMTGLQQAATAIEDKRSEVENRASSLVELIERLTNAQATSYFQTEASTYRREARALWWSRLAVIVVAAGAALLPLATYYYERFQGTTPWLAGRELTAAHVTAALALGAVAGIILARARGRDRARQRARDLEVAVQTMFVYAEQIDDKPQRQAFVRDMGFVVLNAFLRQDTPATEGDKSVLGALRQG